MSDVFKKNYRAYIDKGFSVIPDRPGSKKAAVTKWPKYSSQMPTEEELTQWEESFPDGNIAVMMGEVSGIIALDFDSKDPKIIELIEPLLPESPVEKKGAKGWTRYFRYTGEVTDIISWSGEVVFEILSSKRKTTIPPSVHPDTGADYQWKDKGLLEVDVKTLPKLPPFLVSSIKLELSNKFGASTSKTGKIINGRNSYLSNFLGNLLNSSTHTADYVITELIKEDRKVNEVPYFSDPNESHSSTCEYTNALLFYASHMSSINGRNFEEGKEYLTPVFEGVTTLEELKERASKKSIARVEQKSVLKSDSILADSAIKRIYETINANSHVYQPELALAAALSVMSTLGGKKFTYQGLAPNLYLCGISESGSGKNASLDFTRNLFDEIDCQYLLGAGDYVSNASLVDSLPLRPVRLDIMDEVGGKLKTMNSGNTEYADKIGDILAELFTSSNSYYMGRALAGQNGVPTIRGACDKPNVNILAATTPTGFREGVTKDSIAKGLMGRFLLFFGDPYNEAKRVPKKTELDSKTLDHLRKLAHFNFKNNVKNALQDKPSEICELEATDEADTLLELKFKEFDQLRLSKMGKPEAPIAARLYQQMIKLVMCHAIARPFSEVPVIDVVDVEFGYSIVKCYYNELAGIIRDFIFNSKEEKARYEVLKQIQAKGFIRHHDLVRATPQFQKRIRDNILEDLKEAEYIGAEVERDEKGGRQYAVYYIRDEKK